MLYFSYCTHAWTAWRWSCLRRAPAAGSGRVAWRGWASAPAVSPAAALSASRASSTGTSGIGEGLLSFIGPCQNKWGNSLGDLQHSVKLGFVPISWETNSKFTFNCLFTRRLALSPVLLSAAGHRENFISSLVCTINRGDSYFIVYGGIVSKSITSIPPSEKQEQTSAFGCSFCICLFLSVTKFHFVPAEAKSENSEKFRFHW